MDLIPPELNKVILVAVFPDSKAQVQDELSQHSLTMEVIANVNLAQLNVSATPTLILIDESGRVRNAWVGLLSPEKQLAVIRMIKSCTPSIGSLKFGNALENPFDRGPRVGCTGD